MPETARPRKKLPIGISDFRMLREEDRYYVDKTGFIREVMDAPAQALLFPRPRRFGKTLNLSMLRYFFEKSDEDRGRLFDGTGIRDTEFFHRHQGRYAVIFLTFKDIKEPTWPICLAKIQQVIRDAFKPHSRLFEETLPHASDKAMVRRIMENRAEQEECENALKYLSEFLHSCGNRSVVILIDEYDTPIHAAYNNGYFQKAVDFMRNFLSGGLKDNPFLIKGVLTGILRVAKESVFSGLNNLDVYTILSPRFSDSFGFTEPEIERILADYGASDQLENLAEWYNGYRFGDEVIYNPWSVLHFIDKRGECVPYWVNTADTGIIDRLATRGGRELRQEIGTLLEGGAIQKPITDALILRDLEHGDEPLWSFLLFSGYLKPGEKTGTETWELRIPNREVEIIYRRMVRRWFTEKSDVNHIESLLKALTAGEVEDFEELLSGIVRKVLSWHDTAGPEPEQFYHAFLLGLLVWLEGEYEVKSNRESGLGRYDAMLIPRDRNRKGIVLEFKRVNERKKETPEQALEAALKQMETRRYAEELTAAGVSDVLKLALVFRGKELWVRQG